MLKWICLLVQLCENADVDFFFYIGIFTGWNLQMHTEVPRGSEVWFLCNGKANSYQ